MDLERNQPDLVSTEWMNLLGSWLTCRPTAGHPEGLASLRGDLRTRLGALGFSVTHHESSGAEPILIATRPPSAGVAPSRWVGLFAHYDVEEAGSGWSMDPFVLSVKKGRVYGRGVADNLGPLALRLISLARASVSPGLVWVIQGEEEIGSPFAHQIFPDLRLPSVTLWLEETGYFEQDGTQRLLLRRPTPLLHRALRALADLAAAEGREQRILDRYLNKAFGQARCPCLLHLVGDRPYLAIGPNDTSSRIHAPDESLPLDTLALSRVQFVRLLEEVAACA